MDLDILVLSVVLGGRILEHIILTAIATLVTIFIQKAVDKSKMATIITNKPLRFLLILVAIMSIMSFVFPDKSTSDPVPVPIPVSDSVIISSKSELPPTFCELNNLNGIEYFVIGSGFDSIEENIDLSNAFIDGFRGGEDFTREFKSINAGNLSRFIRNNNISNCVKWCISVDVNLSEDNDYDFQVKVYKTQNNKVVVKPDFGDKRYQSSRNKALTTFTKMVKRKRNEIIPLLQE